MFFVIVFKLNYWKSSCESYPPAWEALAQNIKYSAFKLSFLKNRPLYVYGHQGISCQSANKSLLSLLFNWRYCQKLNVSPCAGLALPMATVDIKNPEINNVRFLNSHSHQQPYHLNNILSHSGLTRKDKKTKSKKKKLTKADIGTPSNFQ